MLPGVKYLCAMTTIRNVHRKMRRIVVEGGWLWETRRGFSKACGKVAEGQLSIGRQAPDRGEGSPRGEGYVFHRQPPGDHGLLSSADSAAAVWGGVVSRGFPVIFSMIRFSALQI